MAADEFSLTRFLLSLVFAAVATLALAYLMQSLIHSDDAPYQDAPISAPISWVPLIEDEEPESRPKPPEVPPPVELPPPTTLTPEIDLQDGGFHLAVLTKPVVDPGRVGPRTGHADGDLLPIVAIRPQYPERANSRGIEGYVTLEFTVNRSGRVENPVVIDAQPSGVFDRAALRAISRFRYRPKVVNGKPLAVHGVKTRLRFDLDG